MSGHPDRSLCLAVHPLAGAVCTEPNGHDGPHGTTTGIRVTWTDPEDEREARTDA